MTRGRGGTGSLELYGRRGPKYPRRTWVEETWDHQKKGKGRLGVSWKRAD